MTAETRHEYSRLRKLAEQRSKRLETAGYSGYHAPKLRDIDKSDIKAELRKLNRWLGKEESTLKGAKAAEVRRIEEQAARAERRRMQQQEYRRRKAEEQGREYKPRPPITEEQRRERRREQQRAYRERRRERAAALDNYIKQQAAMFGPGVETRLQNLVKGLAKYGITVKTPEELDAWRKYINEREKDSDNKRYQFDLWLDEAANATDQDARRITSDDLLALINDFQQWQADQARMAEEFTRPRASNEYSQADLGKWNAFFKS